MNMVNKIDRIKTALRTEQVTRDEAVNLLIEASGEGLTRKASTDLVNYWQPTTTNNGEHLMSDIRNQAERAISTRAYTPGRPEDGPYPSTVEEVADELITFIRDLDQTCARGVAEIVSRQLRN